MGISYSDAGVDIDAGNKLIDTIKPMARATKRLGADTELGGFGGLFDLAACKFKDPVLVSATDGVGTKLKLAIELNKHNTIGIDLVAMCVNDLVVQGAEPLFFLDYFATGKLENNVAAQVIKGISEGCILAGCALIGGETAEMPGMYSKDHYDLAGFAVGAVERSEILPKNNIKEGDVILGLASSGFHSNGYSLVRHIINTKKIDIHNTPSFIGKANLAEDLLNPTKIYVKSCLSIKNKVKAFAHITGGGLTENIPRVLSDDIAANIDFKSCPKLEIFSWLQKLGGIEPLELVRTFNCGIGMIVVVDQQEQDTVIAELKKQQEEVFVIGHISKRKDLAVNISNI